MFGFSVNSGVAALDYDLIVTETSGFVQTTEGVFAVPNAPYVF
jgi:hypothetical protein